MGERVFIGVGSNIDPERNIPAAGLLLLEKLRLVGVSDFYRTAPLDRPEQDTYLNGVFEVDTKLQPRLLKFGILRPIEEKLGRCRSEDAYAPREIDLDILVYGPRRIIEADLTIPDPDMWQRPFVVIPLLELAPDLVLPGGERLAESEAGRRREGLQLEKEFSQALKERLKQ